MAMALQAARAIAQQIIDSWQGDQIESLALEYVQEFPHSWVFTYNSQAFLETGAIEHALGGNSGPIVISKSDGSMRLAPADVEVESYLKEPPIGEWVRLRAS
jgi:Immunity protein 35